MRLLFKGGEFGTDCWYCGAFSGSSWDDNESEDEIANVWFPSLDDGHGHVRCADADASNDNVFLAT